MGKRGPKCKYKPEYCQGVIDFFDVKLEDDCPSFCDYAHRIGIVRSTLHTWSKKFPDFGVAYARAKQLQEHWLTINGLKGNSNTAFTIFMLKNRHGWVDKKQVDVNQKTDLKVNLTDDEKKTLKQTAKEAARKMALKVVKAA